MKALMLIIGAILIAALPAQALNDVPASNNGIGWFPYAYQFGSDTFDEFQTTMSQQGYDFSYKKDASHTTHPYCRPQQLIDYCQNGIGKLLIDSHGNTWFYVACSYEKNATGQQQWSNDYNELTGTYGLTFSECQAIIEATEYIIIFTEDWVANRYTGYHSDNASGVVWCATCFGHSFYSSWGTHATLTYDYSVDNGHVKSDAEKVLRRLNGKNGTPPLCRVLTNAVDGCHVKLEGNGDWVLAPTIISSDPSPGWLFHDAGPFYVSVEFDVAMRQDDPLTVLSVWDGYVFQDGWDPFTPGPNWSNDHEVYGFVVSLTCPAPVNPNIIAVHAVSAVGEHQLDGGYEGINAGEGPNRDDYTWQFYTDASQRECDNWATSFASCGAFRENGNTVIYWQAEFQRGSVAYDIYHGNGSSLSLLTSVPANVINPDLPAGYSITEATDATVFEIVERDAKGNETRSRPFQVGDRPDNFEAVINIGNDYPQQLDLTFRSEERNGSMCCDGDGGRTERPYYIFVSARSDFLSACQPAITLLENMGRPTETVLTTKDPNDIFWSIEPYY